MPPATSATGWEGIDYNLAATEWIAETYGFPAFCGDFMNYQGEVCDAVAMLDVIEHLPRPLAAIEKARSLTRPGGVFVLSTMDSDSLVSRLVGKRLEDFRRTREHLYFFNRTTIGEALRRAGFEVLRIDSHGLTIRMDFLAQRVKLAYPRVGAALERLVRPAASLEPEAALRSTDQDDRVRSQAGRPVSGRPVIRAGFSDWLKTRIPQVTAGLVVLHILLCAALFEPKLHTGGDSVTYVLLAESLLTPGDGYALSIGPGPPQAHTKYPPGYPATLAPLVAVFGRNFVVLKLLSLVFTAGAVLLFCRYALRGRDPLPWFFLALAFAVSPGVIDYSRWMLSEAPFLFFTLLGLRQLGPGPRERRNGQAVLDRFAGGGHRLLRAVDRGPAAGGGVPLLPA